MIADKTFTAIQRRTVSFAVYAALGAGVGDISAVSGGQFSLVIKEAVAQQMPLSVGGRARRCRQLSCAQLIPEGSSSDQFAHALSKRYSARNTLALACDRDCHHRIRLGPVSQAPTHTEFFAIIPHATSRLGSLTQIHAGGIDAKHHPFFRKPSSTR